MSDDGKRSGGFWTSVPGVLTGAAAIVTAITGLFVALHQIPSQPQPSIPAPRPPESTAAPASSPVSTSGFTGPMGPLEREISYSGGDMYDRPANSPEQCVQLCANDDRCRAVTFIVSQQRCWVKNNVNAPQQSSDMISSRKQG